MRTIQMTKISDPAHRTNCDQYIATKGRTAERIWNEAVDEAIEKELVASCNNSNKERCGFLTEDQDIFYVDNVHAVPQYNFLMDADDLARVVNEIYDIRQTRILGVFHTHPNNVPWPTPRDLVGWPNTQLGWRYWIVTNSEVIEWRLVTE